MPEPHGLSGSGASVSETPVPGETGRKTDIRAVSRIRPLARPLHLFRTMRKEKRRHTRRGLSTVETVLTVAAVMGCFVYPLSQAMRTVGARIAADSERSHGALLEQKR
jgi:hypothetical protein